MRTLLSVELRGGPVVVGAELQDARAWVTDETPVNTTLINPIELLQAHVGVHGKGVLVEGDEVSLTAGRMTIDLANRRLVARNEYRNTINGFTGVDLHWTSPDEDAVRAFVVVPVVRLPADADGLRANRVVFDQENLDVLFWAAHVRSRPLGSAITAEGYLLGLHERDGDTAASADRRLVTPGLRVLRPAAAGTFDGQLEVMGQIGRSRASVAPEDTVDLDHRAFSVHAALGYRWDAPWAPRVVLQHDYATGDASPDDGANNRFDPLFGARRFEFGPTSLYGAIARSNLNAPALRVEVSPSRKVDSFAAYRLVWLASARDAWTPAGLRDPSGSSGTFVGQQVEARVRWHLLPKNLSFDVGGASFLRGGFATEAPGGVSTTPIFVYTQVTGTI
jgi:hypothetical protein